jgi:hypothetical protein
MGHYQKYETPPPKTKPKALKYYNLGPKYLGKTIYHPHTIDIFFHILPYSLSMLASGPSTFYLAKAQAN